MDTHNFRNLTSRNLDNQRGYMVERMKNLDLEVLEILDNWSKEEILDRVNTLSRALSVMKEWNSLTRDQKDDLWIKAEE